MAIISMWKQAVVERGMRFLKSAPEMWRTCRMVVTAYESIKDVVLARIAYLDFCACRKAGVVQQQSCLVGSASELTKDGRAPVESWQYCGETRYDARDGERGRFALSAILQHRGL